MNLTGISGIIFDFGFTLFYFEEATVENYFKSFQIGLNKSVTILKQERLFKDEKMINKFINLFNKKRQFFWKESLKTKNEFETSYIFKHVLKMMVRKNLIPSIHDFSQEFYDRLAIEFHSEEISRWKPFKHVKTTLESLSRAGIQLAVLSNHPHHKSIETMLKKHNLFDFFEIVVTSAEFGRRKPAPEIFLHTLKKMNLKDINPSECLVCGDEYADIVGGHRAGLKTVLCERKIKFPFEKEINVPNVIRVNEISEILTLINFKTI